MEVKQIVNELDKEIARLKEARALLASDGSGSRKPVKAAAKSAAPGRTGKRNLTPEGRQRISEALRRRWAQRRKAAGKASKTA